MKQVTDMLKGFEAETNKGMDAYQAELHAVELTRKLGGLLLKHDKKTLLAKHLRTHGNPAASLQK